ncbi:MAG: HAD-IIB family hydrolase [Clostridiaceae bacterium]|nr:HAD-IIB family hydrolase [Clostridiaceae bacterium]
MSNNTFLINFDLDNTIAGYTDPIYPQALEKIKALSTAGHIVTINSGKPIFYLVGLCRQANLQDIWLIGESGAEICHGIALPLDMPFKNLVKEESKLYLQTLREEIRQTFGNRIWFEPTVIALSVFFDNDQTQSELMEFFNRNKSKFEKYNINVFPMVDCFDLMPDNIDKSTGIRTLQKHFSIADSNTIAIGDSWNDIPMFDYCQHSIVIDFSEYQSQKDIHHVANIDEALQKLDEIIQKG